MKYNKLKIYVYVYIIFIFQVVDLATFLILIYLNLK